MEAVQETKQPLYLCSWDMSKAFDSPSKNLLKLAWTRIWVPSNIAEYLVSLDVDAHTVIRSPVATAAFKRDGYKAFHDVSKESHCKKIAEFKAGRGVGQGDVGSPTNWNAVFDILLVALANLPSQLNITGPHGNLHPVTGIGYADDLLTAAGSSAGLQDQADLVSIFAMIFGLDIAHTKLRTLTTHWSGTHWHQTKMSPIKVHKSL